MLTIFSKVGLTRCRSALLVDKSDGRQDRAIPLSGVVLPALLDDLFEHRIAVARNLWSCI